MICLITLVVRSQSQTRKQLTSLREFLPRIRSHFECTEHTKRTQAGQGASTPWRGERSRIGGSIATACVVPGGPTTSPHPLLSNSLNLLPSKRGRQINLYSVPRQRTQHLTGQRPTRWESQRSHSYARNHPRQVLKPAALSSFQSRRACQ